MQYENSYISDQCQLKEKRSNVKVKRFSTNKKVPSQEILKALALTIQKLLARLKFPQKWVKLQGRGYRVKNNGTRGKSYHREYSCEISKLWHSLFKSYLMQA